MTSNSQTKDQGATPTIQSQIQLDPELTLALAQASIAAYNDYEGKSFTPPPNYRFVARFTGWDQWIGEFGQEEKFGLIFSYYGPPRRIIVAFRGTDSVSDMFEDAFWESATFQPYRNSVSPAADDVCSGFNGIYSSRGGSMTASMQQQIFNLLPAEVSEVYITGHSLGAALSQLFTLDMRVSSPAVPITTINFASPQVGGQDWQSACNAAGATSCITRVINHYDWVPDFPQAIFDWWDNYVSIGAQFQTAFYGQDWPFDELSCHSILNLQTVLSHCLWLNPQVWTGTFWDATDPSYEMYSVAPPAAQKDEIITKLQALRALRPKPLERGRAAGRPA
jgi:hypothetical protein